MTLARCEVLVRPLPFGTAATQKTLRIRQAQARALAEAERAPIPKPKFEQHRV